MLTQFLPYWSTVESIFLAIASFLGRLPLIYFHCFLCGSGHDQCEPWRGKGFESEGNQPALTWVPIFYLKTHFPSSLLVVTDLLMNETISDLALAKVRLSCTPPLSCIVFCIQLDWVGRLWMQLLDAGQAGRWLRARLGAQLDEHRLRLGLWQQLLREGGAPYPNCKAETAR